jgi:hypothetical protein
MTTYPTADQRYPVGSTLLPLEVEVSSFPFDPSGEGYTVTLQAVSQWTRELVLDDIPAEVEHAVQDVVEERWSFTVRTSDAANFPGGLLAPGPYWCCFKIVDGEGGVCYIPASGWLSVEILPASIPVVVP